MRGIRKIQWIVAGVALVLTPSMFFAYLESLPEGEPVSLAVWPAIWILMILVAIILALELAARRKPTDA